MNVPMLRVIVGVLAMACFIGGLWESRANQFGWFLLVLVHLL